MKELLFFAFLAGYLAIFIGLAKLGGYLAIRARQPAVFGELSMGLILGPSLLNVLRFVGPKYGAEIAKDVNMLAFVGVLILMFLAGLEVSLEDMRRSGKVALLSGVLGSLVPIGTTALVFTYLFGYPWVESIFLGLVMGATSVSISAQTLIDLQVLRTPVGYGLLGAAVVDDVLIILFLSLFTAFVGAGADGVTTLALVEVVGRMVFFFVLAWVVTQKVLPWLAARIDRREVYASKKIISFALIVMFTYAWAAEYVGHVAAITGSFIAGLGFSRTLRMSKTGELRLISADWGNLKDDIEVLAYGLLVPLFFINIGLQTDLRLVFQQSQSILEALVLVLLAIVTKVAGSGLGAWIGGLNAKDALRLGVGMTSRGEVGLIVATVGIQLDVLPAQAMAAVVLMVVVTTLLTPPALRALYRNVPTQNRLE